MFFKLITKSYKFTEIFMICRPNASSLADRLKQKANFIRADLRVQTCTMQEHTTGQQQ